MVSKPSSVMIRVAVPEINSAKIEAAAKVLSSGWLIQDEVSSLPIYPELKREQIKKAH